MRKSTYRQYANSSSSRSADVGMTLIEMLVATVITLLLVYGLTQAFVVMSGTVTSNRATLELAGSLRGVTYTLHQDLEGLTAPVRPWPKASSGVGYFEYYEGPQSDYYHATGTYPSIAYAARSDTHVGDFDDVLMFTTRSVGAPFVGRIDPAYLGVGTDNEPRSTVAEIIWWMQLSDDNANGLWDAGERFRLHRRVLLVVPELNTDGALPTVASVAAFSTFINDNDLSCRVGSGGKIIANSLEDLTLRKNRFAHLPHFDYGQGGFPHVLDLVASNGLLATGYAQSGSHIGEDVMQGDMLGFDVRAFDPSAPLRQETAGFDGLVPGDVGYISAPTTIIGAGAFVDLNYGRLFTSASPPVSAFVGAPHGRSGLSGSSSVGHVQPYYATYDTWALDYEFDGVNQDLEKTGAPLPLFPPSIADFETDEGTDGLDNDSANGVDDIGERETSPPYPVPLRGLEVRLRLYDPDTRQVRQTTVISDFTPE